MLDDPAHAQLSSELWAEVLTKLASPAELSSASATCTALRDAYTANRDAVWTALLALPRIQPYANVTKSPGENGPPKYKFAMRLRSAWRNHSPEASLISFHSYVRCVKVDWSTYSIAVGLYDGTVYTCDLEGHFKRPAGEGGHSSGEAIALDYSGAILVSGSGEPSYYEQSCPGATLRVVDLSCPPWKLVHEIGSHDGGHTDSINDIKIVACVWGASPRCVACSASSDASLIVWNLTAGKPLHRLSAHRAAVTALALVGEAPCTTILSCGRDSGVREWDWRAGACTRVIVEPPPPSLGLSSQVKEFSAISFHAPTSSFALGNFEGSVRLYRYNRRRGPAELPCYPLTGWCQGGGHPSRAREVARICHDGDKLAYVARSGVLEVLWLGPLPDEGQPFGLYADGRSVRQIHLAQGGFSQDIDIGEVLPQAALAPGLASEVRMYVSSIDIHGGMLVADGFDNSTLVCNALGDD